MATSARASPSPVPLPAVPIVAVRHIVLQSLIINKLLQQQLNMANIGSTRVVEVKLNAARNAQQLSEHEVQCEMRLADTL